MDVGYAVIEKRKKKPKRKTLAALKRAAWRLLSELVRRTPANDKGNCWCVTCGAPHHWKDLQAGHAIGGRKASVLFDEEILYPQCVDCNIFKGGRYGEFAAFLIRKHGLEWYEKKVSDSKKPAKLTRADVEEKIENYKKRLEALG